VQYFSCFIDISGFLTLTFQKLLSEPATRLGKKGVDEITRHSFFNNIDWGKLHNSKPVFLPTLENDVDCSYFEGVSCLNVLFRVSLNTTN
jgi:hypothetical protein